MAIVLDALRMCVAGVARRCAVVPTEGGAPEARIALDFLATVHAPLDPPQQIDTSLLVVNVPTGGWVRGPRLQGRIVPPGADWLRILPSGVARLDVRFSLITEDEKLIYVSYSGVMSASEQTWQRAFAGEQMGSEDIHFVPAPVFQTAAPEYAWLNHVQAVGKLVSFKAANHIRYDLFVVR